MEAGRELREWLQGDQKRRGGRGCGLLGVSGEQQDVWKEGVRLKGFGGTKRCRSSPGKEEITQFTRQKDLFMKHGHRAGTHAASNAVLDQNQSMCSLGWRWGAPLG